IRVSSSSSGLALISTTLSVPSMVSRWMSPLGMRTVSSSAPGVSNVSRLIAVSEGAPSSRAADRSSPRCVQKALERTWSPSDSPSFSALAVASEPLAGSLDPTARAPRKGADDQAVHGNSFASRIRLDRDLERLGETERDPRRQPVLGRRLRRRCLLADVYERRVLADEAHLDVPLRQLPADLERSLAEGVEEPQPSRAADRLQHARRCGPALPDTDC